MTAEKYVWPSDLAEWSAAFEKHLDSFLPKLTVLVKDAIPISIVNLRSAVQSDEASETEMQLKLLIIQRLSQERQLFVLERQKMQSLSEEKELNADDSAFWNGSYLLEGVVDQNGYSKDTIMINARLSPPKGGATVAIEVSGSRTNFAEVINQLAAKIIEALKINSTVKEWNAADEAAQYFDEAKWALKWKVYSEAQAAANSAWALGKRDLECASIRVNSYLADAKPAGPDDLYEQGSYKNETGIAGDVDAFIREMTEDKQGNVLYSRTTNTVQYVILKKQPDPIKLARVVRALELYTAQLPLLQSSDSVSVCMSIKMLLVYDGHKVQTVDSGEAALTMLEQDKFDLIITDYSMQGMKGAQLAALVKQRWSDQPIIMITAFADEFTIHGKPSEGVDFVISKPFSQKELREAIARVLP